MNKIIIRLKYVAIESIFLSLRLEYILSHGSGGVESERRKVREHQKCLISHYFYKLSYENVFLHSQIRFSCKK